LSAYCDTMTKRPKGQSKEIAMTRQQWLRLCQIFGVNFYELPDNFSGETLKKWREDSSLTQQELATSLNIAVSTLRRWEKSSDSV
jgi:DNA-binding transcriptional regulator YiaG